MVGLYIKNLEVDKDIMLSYKKTYDQLIEQFINGVKCTIDVDYANKNSVKKNNKGVDQYRQAAQEIAKFFPDKKEDFSRLLHHPINKVRLNCAVCMIELMNYNEMFCLKALTVIKSEYFKKDRVEKIMINLWLKDHGFDEIEKIY